MAIVTIPLLGRAKKSAGEMTFTKWKDKNVLKNKASNVANPDTVNQQMRRGMFSTLVVSARTFLPVFDLGFVAYRNTMSQFNAFIKYNYGVLVTAGTAPAYSISAKDMIISKGPLSPTDITAVTATNASPNVTVTWPTAVLNPDQASTDLVRIVLYNEDSNGRGYNIGSIDRSAGTATIVMNSNNSTGDHLDAYLFFSRADNSMASDSRDSQIVV
jgi:hypothetical protein